MYLIGKKRKNVKYWGHVSWSEGVNHPPRGKLCLYVCKGAPLGRARLGSWPLLGSWLLCGSRPLELAVLEEEGWPWWTGEGQPGSIRGSVGPSKAVQAICDSCLQAPACPMRVMNCHCGASSSRRQVLVVHTCESIPGSAFPLKLNKKLSF